MINRWKIYLYRLKKNYTNLEENSPYKYALLKEYHRFLITLDESDIGTIRKIYNDYIHSFDRDIKYALVSLIVINELKEKMTKINEEVFIFFINFLVKGKIPNIREYIKIFFNAYNYELLEELSFFWDPEKLTDSLFVLLKYEYGSIYNIKENDLSKVLCQLVHIDYSPIFKNNFSFSNIRNALEECMHKINLNSDNYSFMLDEFVNLEMILNEDEKKQIIEAIKKIESLYSNDLANLILIIIKYLRKLNNDSNKLHLVRLK